jgi:hypothetical protein
MNFSGSFLSLLENPFGMHKIIILALMLYATLLVIVLKIFRYNRQD